MNTDALMTILQPLSVSDRVATLRKINRLSQQSAADQIGVHRETWASWEAAPKSGNHHAPGQDNRDALARMFGIPAYVFTPDFGTHNLEQVHGEEKAAELIEAQRSVPDASKMLTPVPHSQREDAASTPTQESSVAPVTTIISSDIVAQDAAPKEQPVITPAATGVTRIVG